MGKHYEQLSAEERAVIMVMRGAGSSVRAVAEQLGRSASTISRELRRNGDRSASGRSALSKARKAGDICCYDATRAGDRARRLRLKPRRLRKLCRSSLLWQQVVERLHWQWSPEQIAATLGGVSHETIYSAIYAMPRGALRRELTMLLRQGRARRRPRSRGEDRRGRMHDFLSIHIRPPAANDRLLPGHWEGDFIKGAGNHSAVGTLVDRYSLFVMLAKMDGCSATAALTGFSTAFAPLDPALKQTLTYDQGKEMALHRRLAESTGLAIYFADPHSPWQRGINENTNGLLRQYLPKGTELSQYSQRDLDQIAWSLNTRPRKSLGFKTPAEVFFTRCFDRTAKSTNVALDF
ncbi:IS30 family transposase [Polycyclovorans algicola]|uniref:IS30 family transposase n=1 Tax=Polycyclovorans algicola TaxID=616992 RepID=UPI0004A6C638|nr:IS30 family transposase [Polycyclovorans algicola]